MLRFNLIKVLGRRCFSQISSDYVTQDAQINRNTMISQQQRDRLERLAAKPDSEIDTSDIP
jgi:hypothetical protein